VTDDDWQSIEAAFHHAISLAGDEREAFVADFEARDPALGERLRALVEADRKSDSNLEAPIESGVKAMAQATVDPWLGRRIAAWTITRRVATGGMGAVFAAERSDGQFEQRVAIKLMNAQLLAPDAIARFKAERQILADLNHPYIAKLHDGGTTEDGVPYLVMEYVDGLPIDRHCDLGNMTIDERLSLFMKVCDAVDYAHRRLTVHRDLKPSNILVDAHGNPKLLDFGIAKLLDEHALNMTVAVTRDGARAMTPEYASPEQVRGQPVSVATDVYSLGVLLYRLMTGQSPYGASVTTPLEYERAIIEQDPKRPSTVFSGTGRSSAGGTRGLTDRQLRNRLSGDLDNIALKTLQKEPERRYPSVSALAADVGRYLRHEPVEARGNDWLYVTKKFVVRNARGVALTIAVVAGIAALVTFYTLRLADERDRANLSAAEAREVAGFLTDMFASASPHVAQGEPVTAVDLLEQGREKIGALGEQPELQAELYRIMGSSYTALGYTGESIPMLETALALKQSVQPDDRLGIAEAMHNLSEAHRQHGQRSEAEVLMRQSLDLLVAELGDQDERVARTKARLGVVLFDLRRVDEGFRLLQEALDTKIALGTGDDLMAIDIRANMANSLDLQGRYEEALALHDETIALSRTMEGELAPNTIIRMGNRALVLNRLGRFDEAIAQIDEAIERGEKVWPENADQIAFMIGVRAATLKRVGRFEESLRDYRQAEEMTRSGIGEDNTRYVARLRGVGSVLAEMGRFDEAEATDRQALEIAGRVDGEDGYQAALLYLLLGMLMNDQHEFAAAEPLLRRAESLRDLLGNNSTLVAQKHLAMSLSGQGRFDEAEELFKDVLAKAEDSYGPQSASLIGYLVAASHHYRDAGNPQRAVEFSSRAFDIARLEKHRGYVDSVYAVAEHGLTLAALGRRDEAAPLIVEARKQFTEYYGPDDARVAELN